MYTGKSAVIISSAIVLFLSLASQATATGPVTLQWDPNLEPDIAGYRLSYGPGSGNYTQQIDVGNTTLATTPFLADGTYFFVVTAYNSSLVESPPSNEVSATVGIGISGTISYCSNPVSAPVPNVTLTLTGSASGSTLSDVSGNYTHSPLFFGGSYIVTPSKAARAPGSAGISTVDVVATQRHFLNVAPIAPGCRRTAADVDLNTVVNTIDVVAIQRFFLGASTGIANTGKYQFTPASRAYPGVVSNQAGQNYDALIYGDVAPSFVHLPESQSQSVRGDDISAVEIPATVAAVALPEVAVDQSMSSFIAAVTTTAIDATNRLVGFQGDFTFDERVVTFQEPPVQNAGLTAGDWNVSGNVLPGEGPIRTLRISAYSNDFTALSESGTLFELRMTRVSQVAQSTPLIWAAAPDQFIFIDANLKTQPPANAAPGSVTTSGGE